MEELVIVKNDEVFTNSMIIANETDNQHESVVRLIAQHKERFERFGKVEFIDLKSGKRGRPTRVYQLNEPQATLLITFLDNSDKVADFKTKLVEQFYKIRQLLLQKQTNLWLETRQQGKLSRKSETDVIKDLIEYAKEQGSEHADKLYMTYSKLANKMVGISKRDLATVNQLNTLSFIENIILNQIRVDMSKELHYKQIYQNCKKQIELFKEIAYLETA